MGVSKKALDVVQKLYGKEAVRKLSETETDVDFLPSGSLYLDYTLGGGFARGRIIEIFGPESSGKTTIAIEAIAETQRSGLNAFFCDAEQAFDKDYAEKLGVNVEELILNQPDSGEQALNVTIAMIETGEIALVVIDSTSALTPKAELEGEMEDQQIGLQARMLSKALRKITAVAARANCAVIFISQLRENIGPYGGQKIGVGNAMKFYASQRLNVKKSYPPIMEGTVAVGHKMLMKATKNKVHTPYKTCEVILKYGHGYDKGGEVVMLAEEMGIIERKGSWYAYQGTNLAQGLDKTALVVADNPELHDELLTQVVEGLKNQ